jgi:predicted membrane protein
MADNQSDEGRRESDPRDSGESLKEQIGRSAGADWQGPPAWRGRRRRHSHGPGIVFAFLLIGAGVLLFLDNVGLFHFHDIWRFWPVALIALGVSKLFETRGAGGMVWAAMATLVGTGILLDNLGIWHANWNIIWPLGLIAFGILKLVTSLERKRALEDPNCFKAGSGDASSENTVQAWATFTGLKRRIDSQNFQGGELLAVFGGIEVDLRRAKIASDKEAIIDINATFGGIDIKVPETWLVIVKGQGIFGGYEDKTIPPRPQEGVTPPKLVITGFAIFGGIEIKN